MSFECFVVRLKWKVFPSLLAPCASSHLRSTLITFLYTLSALEWQTTTTTRGWIISPNSAEPLSTLAVLLFLHHLWKQKRKVHEKELLCNENSFDTKANIWYWFFLRSRSSLYRFCHHRFIFAGFVRFVCRLGSLSFLVASCSGPGQKNTLSVTKTFLRELRNIIKNERHRQPRAAAVWRTQGKM